MSEGRGRETSHALVEIRTVLSRAQTALDSLVAGPTEGRSVYVDGKYSHYERDFDPDHEEMEKALRQVVVLLSPWRRDGRTKRG